MKKPNIFFIVPFFILYVPVYAQTGIKQSPGKNRSQLVKAHRGTIVPGIKEKVGKSAHLKYAAFPKIGSVITALPAGAIEVSDSTHSYFYKSGIFYVQNKTDFVVTLPVPGMRIKGLPIGYRRVAVGDKIYFYYFGTFYQQAGNSDIYETLAPPETAIVDGLPDGYTIKKIDGTEYYFLNNTYYAETDAPYIEGGTGFEVVMIIDTY